MIVLTVNISDLKDGGLNLEINPAPFRLHFFIAHVPSFTRCCCYLEFPADENFREKMRKYFRLYFAFFRENTYARKLLT